MYIFKVYPYKMFLISFFYKYDNLKTQKMHHIVSLIRIIQQVKTFKKNNLKYFNKNKLRFHYFMLLYF